MKNQLVRCPTCKRHIYESETSCPFCARQTNASPAILAAALSAGLAVAGCGGETPPPMTPVEVAPQPDKPKEIAEDPKPEPTSPAMTVAPAYGAPPVQTAPMVPPAAAYGAPPPMTPTPNPR